LLLLLASVGCAEKEPTGDLVAHPAAWSLEDDPDFHGERVERSGVEGCRGCHGDDLTGLGTASSCFECHDGAGGHPAGWASRPDPAHAATVAVESNDDCVHCHGADYLGGWSEVSCYGCHAGGPSGHPDGWMNDEAASFHGNEVTLDGSVRCMSCHGGDLSGGTSGVSCAQSGCHDSD